MYIIISNASSFNALSVIYKISLSLKKNCTSKLQYCLKVS